MVPLRASMALIRAEVFSPPQLRDCICGLALQNCPHERECQMQGIVKPRSPPPPSDKLYKTPCHYRTNQQPSFHAARVSTLSSRGQAVSQML